MSAANQSVFVFFIYVKIFSQIGHRNKTVSARMFKGYKKAKGGYPADPPLKRLAYLILEVGCNVSFEGSSFSRRSSSFREGNLLTDNAQVSVLWKTILAKG